MTPPFDYVLSILRSKIPGNPADKQKQVDAAIKILTEGKGYLTKDQPKKIVFFKDIV